jgi:drug/metabolite transporter (DMT)-like permease
MLGCRDKRIVVMPRLSPGVLLALAAPLLYGLGIPLSKVLLQQISPWLLIGLSQLGSGVGLGVIYVFRSPHGNFLRGKDWLWFGGAIFFGAGCASVLMMYGLNQTPATTTSLLLNLEGVFTALVAWSFFKDAFSWRIAGGLLIITLGGVVLAVGNGLEQGSLWGEVALVGACFCWALSSNLSQKVAHRDPLFIVLVRSVIAGTVNTCLAWRMGAVFPDPWLMAQAGLVGLCTDGCVVLLYVMALREIGAARTGTFFSLAPFVGAVCSVLLLHESVTLPLLGAGTLMLAGLWICLGEQQENVALDK